MKDLSPWQQRCLTVFLVGALLPAAMRGAAGAPFRCPRPYGLFPHYADCGRFYVCSMWAAFSMSCSPGLFFNPDIDVCDWAAAVECFTEAPPSDSDRNHAKVAARMAAVEKKLASDVTIRVPLRRDGGPRVGAWRASLPGVEDGTVQAGEPADDVEINVYRPLVLKPEVRGSNPPPVIQARRPADRMPTDAIIDKHEGSGESSVQ